MIDKECLKCKRFYSKSCNGVEDRQRNEITIENRCSGFLIDESRNNINPEVILEVKIVQPCHCNVCGYLGTTEVEFGLKYEENNSRTQSFRLCDDCSKKLAELLMNK